MNLILTETVIDKGKSISTYKRFYGFTGVNKYFSAIIGTASGDYFNKVSPHGKVIVNKGFKRFRGSVSPHGI